MLLKKLINTIPVVAIDPPARDVAIEMISCDSRTAMPQGLFVAINGLTTDGNKYIPDALQQGAVVVVKEDANRTLSNGFIIPSTVTVVVVKNARLFLSEAVGIFYEHPSQAVRTIGITGTNGKTTFTYIMESILNAAGKPCGVIGTVNYRIARKVYPSTNTTPGIVDLQKNLATLRSMKVPYCVMEVSSHALAQERLAGIDIKSAVFSNLTQDHLDYHGSMEEYFKAKALLFKNLKREAVASINTDDNYGQQLVSMTQAKVLTYGIDKPATVRGINIHYDLSGTTFDIQFNQQRVSIKTRFIGKHNVYNILSAFTCAVGEGIAIAPIVQGISDLVCVPGRLQPIDLGQPYFIFIDYAHTEDGLVNVIKGLRAVTTNKIIVVFGCGGDRDKTKRPKMGRAVGQLANWAIVTSDNPRSESPEAIINDIIAGFSQQNYDICIDRKEAIARALAMAGPNEVVLLAGKGHEDYQVLKDKTIPFNEQDIVAQLLGKSPHV